MNKIKDLVTSLTPYHKEWDDRYESWNHFSKETETHIIAVRQNEADVVKIVNWARENNQTDIGVVKSSLKSLTKVFSIDIIRTLYSGKQSSSFADAFPLYV